MWKDLDNRELRSMATPSGRAWVPSSHPLLLFTLFRPCSPEAWAGLSERRSILRPRNTKFWWWVSSLGWGGCLSKPFGDGGTLPTRKITGHPCADSPPPTRGQGRVGTLIKLIWRHLAELKFRVSACMAPSKTRGVFRRRAAEEGKVLQR